MGRWIGGQPCERSVMHPRVCMHVGGGGEGAYGCTRIDSSPFTHKLKSMLVVPVGRRHPSGTM